MISTTPTFHTLKNGIRVLGFPLKGTETITVLVLVSVGSRSEKKEHQGISHFLEHLFFKGTKKRPSPVIVAQDIDAQGGVFNAFTTKEFTGFYITAASEDFTLVLDILSDILMNSLFDKEELERERGVILEEMRLYFDTPSEYIGEVFERLLFSNHPLGRDIVGTLESVKHISREDVVSYTSEHYRGGNIVLALSGSLPRDYEKKVEEFFGGFSAGEDGRFIPVKEVQQGPALLIHEKETDQAHIGLGVRAFSVHDKRRETLDVLATLLGAEKSSRMFVEVREKRGLAYYVFSEASYYDDAGHLTTFAGVNVNQVDLAINTILNEYRKIRDEGVSEDELRRTKEHIKGRLLISLESSFKMARYIGVSELLLKKREPLEDYFKRLWQITPKDIQKVAGDILKPENLNLAIIGPFKEKERFEKLLTL